MRNINNMLQTISENQMSIQQFVKHDKMLSFLTNLHTRINEHLKTIGLDNSYFLFPLDINREFCGYIVDNLRKIILMENFIVRLRTKTTDLKCILDKSPGIQGVREKQYTELKSFNELASKTLTNIDDLNMEPNIAVVWKKRFLNNELEFNWRIRA